MLQIRHAFLLNCLQLSFASGGFLLLSFGWWEIASFVSVIFLFLSLLEIKNRFSMVSLEVLIFASSSVYIFSALVDYIFFNNSKQFDDSYIIFIVGLGFLFLFSFKKGLKSIKLSSSSYDWRPLRFKFSVAMLSLLVLILGAYLYKVIIMYSQGIFSAGRAFLYENKGTLIDVLKLAFVVIVVYCYVGTRARSSFRKSFPTVVLWGSLCIFLLCEILLFGDRRVVLIIVFIFIVISKNGGSIRWYEVLFFITLILLFLFFGIIRSVDAAQLSDTLLNFDYTRFLNPTNLEFGAFHVVGSTLFETQGFFYIDPTFAQIIGAMIPSIIYPDRPLAPPVSFVETYFPHIYQAGGGLAYNFLVESFNNLWLLGPVVSGYSLGVFLAFLRHLSHKAIVFSVFYFLISSQFVFIMRLDSVSIVKTMLIFSSFIAVFFVYDRLTCACFRGKN